jgi:Putative transposase of IS4/5 family (DUF4096)
MTKPEEEREFRLGWSLWRRAHQAVAKRCHEVSHAAKHGPLPEEEERLPDLAPPAPAKMSFSTPTVASCLTDEKWKLVKPLMPAQKPPTGRPRSDHRTMLAGVLWIFGNGAGWRDLPQEEFGPWRTVYGHYRQWREEGLWQRIVQMLWL